MTLDLAPELEQTLAALAEAARSLARPWWLIGSAAVALHGAQSLQVRDVDWLVDASDAPRLLTALGLPVRAGVPSDRFRSALFGTWTDPPLEVEIMAGFEVRTGAGWQPLQPSTRQPIALPFGTFYVPDVPELIHHCRLFARPKDAARERSLQALIAR